MDEESGLCFQLRPRSTNLPHLKSWWWGELQEVVLSILSCFMFIVYLAWAQDFCSHSFRKGLHSILFWIIFEHEREEWKTSFQNLASSSISYVPVVFIILSQRYLTCLSLLYIINSYLVNFYVPRGMLPMAENVINFNLALLRKKILSPEWLKLTGSYGISGHL